MEDTLVAPANGTAEAPSTEVIPRARRRRFSVAQKLRILKEADTCKDAQCVGALLRREGIYSAQLSTWRKLHREGKLVGGPKVAAEFAALSAKLDASEKENQRLKKELSKATTIIEVLKKISIGFGINDLSSEGS